MADEIDRMLQAYIERWQRAGIEWLPRPQPVAQSSSLHALTYGTKSPFQASNTSDRRTALELLASEVRKCTKCKELAATRTQTVFGVGPLDPDVCFIGEAPGADEDRQGEPFVGAAGQLLNRIIAACGMKREEVYICNILRCRPPGNRTPRADEAANCRPFLEQTLALVRPKFIVCLGASAANYLLDTKVSIGRMRGRFYDYRGIPVICTYHPAYLLRSTSPEAKRQVWEDMKMLLARMGRPIPDGRGGSSQAS
jgi:DNA polymerase